MSKRTFEKIKAGLDGARAYLAADKRAIACMYPNPST